MIRSSDAVTLSSSRAVSSIRLLFCENNSLRRPFVVTHKRALLPGLGCHGPKAGEIVCSYLYSDCIQVAGPWATWNFLQQVSTGRSGTAETAYLFARLHAQGQPVASDDGVEIVDQIGIPATGLIGAVEGYREGQDRDAAEGIDSSELIGRRGSPG